jgi:transposase InsO family protein
LRRLLFWTSRLGNLPTLDLGIMFRNSSNYKKREESRRDIVDYIEMFYISNRRHAYLGYLSPKEFEETQLLKKAA